MARRLFSCFGNGKSNSSLTNHSTNNKDSAVADLTAEEHKRSGPIVVELFTSQGCVTSPEAELLISRIGRAYVEALNLDSMFTPQIVVQGRDQCATFERPTPESLQVSLQGSLRSKVDNNGANVMIALYECGLVTDITTGENKEKMLANDYVVRKLEKLCSVKDDTAKKTISGTVTFSLWDGFNSANVA
ncbi:unnamed protein product [Withania somnifera]